MIDEEKFQLQFLAKFVEKRIAQMQPLDSISRELSNAGLHAVIDVVTANTDAFIKFSNEWRIVFPGKLYFGASLQALAVLFICS